MKRLLLFQFILLLFLSAEAQIGPRLEPWKAYQPDDMLPLNIDADSKNEIIFSGRDSIYWMEDSLGSLIVPMVSSNFRLFNHGDFNGDFLEDLLLFGSVTVNSVSLSRFSILQNHGNKTFSIHHIDTLSNRLNSYQIPYLLDSEGDGDLDFVFRNDINEVVFYKNNGGFSFVDSVIQDNTVLFQPMDLNGDTLSDLVYQKSYGQTNSWQLVNHINFFSDTTTYIVDTISRAFMKALVGDYDINHDNESDLIFAGTSGQGLFVKYYVDSLQWANNDTIVDFSYQHYVLGVEDLNRDDSLDLIYNSNSVSYRKFGIGLYANGNYPFQHIDSVSSTVFDIDGFYSRKENIIGDSTREVMWAKSDKRNAISYYEFDSTGSPIHHIQYQDDPDLIRPLPPFDLDADGDYDIVFTLEGDRQGFFRNMGNSQYQRVDKSNWAFLRYCRVHAVGDLDGNGYDDLLAIKDDLGTQDSVVVIFSYANDSLSLHKLYSYGQWQSINIELALVDIDNDGDDDIAIPFEYVSGGFKTDLIVCYNNGSGQFSSPQTIFTDTHWWEWVEWGDIDLDGTIEMIPAPFGGGIFTYSWNAGSFSYDDTLNQVPHQGSNYAEHLLFDYEADGDLDIGVKLRTGFMWHVLDSGRYLRSDTLLHGNINDRRVFYDFDRNGEMDYIDANVSDSMYLYFNGIPISLEIPDFINPPDLFIDDQTGDFIVTPSSHTWNTSDELYIYPNHLEDLGKVSGQLYVDLNLNKQFDTSDYAIPFQKIQSNPLNFASFTDKYGQYRSIILNGSYQILPPALDTAMWILSTDSSSYSINHNGSNASYPNRDFGFKTNNPGKDGFSDLASTFLRCSEPYTLYLMVQNTGNLITDYRIRFDQNSNFSFTSSSLAQDSIVSGSHYWTLDSILPFERAEIKVKLTAPNFTSMGNSFAHSLHVDYLDSASIWQELPSDTLVDILRCSYDPNDKLANPIGLGPANFIGQKERIEYTIRFQNTGNDTAFKVVLYDTLSSFLNPQSFQFLNSSQPCVASLIDSNILRFSFDPIVLPDSGADYELSQGFAKFSIETDDSLAVGTQIKNHAGIFFDQNPAVITNTYAHQVYDCSQLDFYADSQITCYGDEVRMFNPEAGFTNYSWTSSRFNLNGDSLNWSSDTSGQLQVFVQSQNTICTKTDSFIVSLPSIVSSNQSASFCQDDSILIAGVYQNQSGIYIDSLLSYKGCDSLVVWQVNELSPSLTLNSDSICHGDTLYIHGSSYHEAGNYRDTLSSALGCDSIILTDVAMRPYASGSLSDSICKGDTLEFNGKQYFEAGTYIDTLNGLLSCDSIVVIDLVSILDSAEISISNDSLVGRHTGQVLSWWDCDADTSIGYIGESSIYPPNGEGRFAFITSTNGCIDTSECLYYLRSGINSVGKMNLRIWPNPTQGKLKIYKEKAGGSKLVFSINWVKNYFEMELRQGLNSIDLSKQADGVYFLKMEAEHTRGEYIRIIKH